MGGAVGRRDSSAAALHDLEASDARLLNFDPAKLFSNAASSYTVKSLKQPARVETTKHGKLIFDDFKPELTSRLLEAGKPKRRFRLEAEVKESVTSELDRIQPTTSLQDLLSYSTKLLRQSHMAFHRQSTRSRATIERMRKAVEKIRKNIDRPVPDASRVGLTCIVELTLLVLNRLKDAESGPESKNKQVLKNMLETAKKCLTSIPLLCLKPGEVPGLAEHLRPVIDSLHKSVLSEDSEFDRGVALEICLGIGLAQGSLEQILAVVDIAIALSTRSTPPPLAHMRGMLVKLEDYKNAHGERKLRSRPCKPGEANKGIEPDKIFQPQALTPLDRDQSKEKKENEIGTPLPEACARISAAIANLAMTADKQLRKQRAGNKGGVVPVRDGLLFEVDGSCTLNEQEWTCKGKEAGFAWNARVNCISGGKISVKTSDNGFRFLRFENMHHEGLVWDKKIQPPCTVFLVDRYFKPTGENAHRYSLGRTLQSRDANWCLGRRQGMLYHYVYDTLIGKAQSVMGTFTMQASTLGSSKQSTWWIDGRKHGMNTLMNPPIIGRLGIGHGTKFHSERSTADIASVIVFKRVLKDEEIFKVFEYLSRRYCIPNKSGSYGGDTLSSEGLQFYSPLAIQVQLKTLKHCVSILRRTQQVYLGNLKVTEKSFRPIMAICRDSLQVLKVHVLQFAKTKMKPEDQDLDGKVGKELREILVGFLTLPSDCATEIVKAMRAESAEAIIQGFGFLAVGVGEQIDFLKELIKHDKECKSEETNEDLKRVLKHIYERFSKFEVATLMFDQMQADGRSASTGNVGSSVESAISEFMRSMVEESISISQANLAKGPLNLENETKDKRDERNKQNRAQQPMLSTLLSLQAHLASRVVRTLEEGKVASETPVELPGPVFQVFADKPKAISGKESSETMRYEERINPKIFTIDVWVKPNNSNAYQVILTTRGTANKEGLDFGIVSGRWTLRMMNTKGGETSVSSVEAAEPGVWTRVSCIYDGESVSMLVNGK
ncbi:hypothetical protein AAMO2058_000100000, partial [Amorphochlora amoebiformis]